MNKYIFLNLFCFLLTSEILLATKDSQVIDTSLVAPATRESDNQSSILKPLLIIGGLSGLAAGSFFAGKFYQKHQSSITPPKHKKIINWGKLMNEFPSKNKECSELFEKLVHHMSTSYVSDDEKNAAVIEFEKNSIAFDNKIYELIKLFDEVTITEEN